MRIKFQSNIPCDDDGTEKWETIDAQGTTPGLPLSSLSMSLPMGNVHLERVIFQ